ncbi:sulfotransferase family protein [Tropicimonas aquimaris]|uniref:Sulfotransferase family protein n=1 Tax=Tropicimonas aquimaris TaxID=914152 RepID=A0ABW3IWM5_9RHOB
MELSVIGSGFGRTGTRSQKDGLERLGFGPCHHMAEVFANPEQVSHRQDLAAGRDMDLEAAFEGYRAQVDWPGAAVWRELRALNPDAKVVHSVRPEEKWVASFAETIGRMLGLYKQLDISGHGRDMLDAAHEIVGMRIFGGDYANPDTTLKAFRLNTEQVRDEVPADQLLVFDVAEGWEPLCRFLEVPVPDEPFPHRNHMVQFWEGFGGVPD